MTRPVIDTIKKSRNYNSQYKRAQNPINPVIDGYFPHHKSYKEMAIARINKTLCAILLVFIMLSAVSYYFVTASEITLNKYRKQALSLNDENVDLQNKLDYLKSYYNVDKAMQKQHLLQKAKNVIEVKDSYSSVNVKTINKASESNNNYRYSIGF